MLEGVQKGIRKGFGSFCGRSVDVNGLVRREGRKKERVVTSSCQSL